MTNGEKLRLIRCALGLTQSELAQKIGISQQWVFLNESRDSPARKYQRAIAAIASENEDKLIQAIGALSDVLPTRKVS